MSNEKQETIADIVSEMRIGDLCASDTAARSMYINDFFASYADRIEAAWKREREAGAEAAQIYCKKTCDRCKTWKRDGKTCVGTCPHQDGMTAEWMSGCPFFS